MFFTFPEDTRWNAERQAVEFEVEIGEYHGVVRVPRRVFQLLLPETPTPERCVEAYYLQRTRFESIAERKTPPAAVDRGRECGGQGAGSAQSARGGSCRQPRDRLTSASTVGSKNVPPRCGARRRRQSC